MFDWLGSLEIREQTARRVVLGLAPKTRVAGAFLAVIGLYSALVVWGYSEWLTILPVLLALFGVLLITLKRRLEVDREAGVLRVHQSALGIGNQSVVPLFHLRAVVIVAQSQDVTFSSRLPSKSRFVAYLDRRVGNAIYLDESRRCASLLSLAEAIAEVAEVRLEYEAPHAS